MRLIVPWFEKSWSSVDHHTSRLEGKGEELVMMNLYLTSMLEQRKIWRSLSRM